MSEDFTLFHSSSVQEWELWDQFLSKTARGIYLQCSDWLNSYSTYGFEPSLILAKDSTGVIVGGMGVVLAKTGPLMILVCPYGPILQKGWEGLLPDLVEYFKKLGKDSGAFLSQLSFPFAEGLGNDFDFAQFFLPGDLATSNFSESGRGVQFKYISSISAIRAVPLYSGKEDAYEKVRKNYKSATRRDVNKSGRMGNELVYAKTETEIRAAYELIELNASNQGYAVRSWEDFGPTLISMVSKGFCLIPCCMNEGRLKGALVIFDFGMKLHYIMGATLREERDLMVGHFLQDQVIQLAVKKGYAFYDISMGGSEGVVRFKEGFGGVILPQGDTRYWIHKPTVYWAYQKLLPWIQRNKKLVAKLLSKSSQ